eukprot:scaffold1671_cov344-Pavlova_lutheri.AAC.9
MRARTQVATRTLVPALCRTGHFPQRKFHAPPAFPLRNPPCCPLFLRSSKHEPSTLVPLSHQNSRDVFGNATHVLRSHTLDPTSEIDAGAPGTHVGRRPEAEKQREVERRTWDCGKAYPTDEHPERLVKRWRNGKRRIHHHYDEESDGLRTRCKDELRRKPIRFDARRRRWLLNP